MRPGKADGEAVDVRGSRPNEVGASLRRDRFNHRRRLCVERTDDKNRVWFEITR